MMSQVIAHKWMRVHVIHRPQTNAHTRKLTHTQSPYMTNAWAKEQTYPYTESPYMHMFKCKTFKVISILYSYI